VSIRQRIERGAEAIITVAASLPVFALVTLLCAGWLSGAIETSGVFQPSGLDGIITFWMTFPILRSTRHGDAGTQAKLDGLIRHIDGVPDDLAGIEKDVERLRATRDA
jgi:low affinity Fe/Cu permease